MPIQPTSNVLPAPPEAASSGPQNGALDRDAFLKLLVAQLSHQDPLKPMEGTEFVTQLAQFTAVEQGIAQTAKLDLISLQLGGLANNEAASLVGKVVTVRGSGIAFDGLLATGASVTLKAPADSVKVEIVGPNGAVVRTLDLGSEPAGTLSVNWDGKNDAGVTQPAGAYQIRVVAKDAQGADVPVTKDVTGTVVSVTFDKGYPELVLDSGARVPISDLVSVSQPTTPGPATPPGAPPSSPSSPSSAQPFWQSDELAQLFAALSR